MAAEAAQFGTRRTSGPTLARSAQTPQAREVTAPCSMTPLTELTSVKVEMGVLVARSATPGRRHLPTALLRGITAGWVGTVPAAQTTEFRVATAATGVPF